MNKLITWIGLIGLSSPVAFAWGEVPASVQKMEPANLLSSVLWQPEQKFIYLPGISAVLRPDQEDRDFRLEMLFDAPVAPESIVPNVQGTWPESQNVVNADLVNVQEVVCNDIVLEDGKDAYQCILDFTIDPATPSGTVGLAVQLDGRYHPNLSYFIVIPETQVFMSKNAIMARSVQDQNVVQKLINAPTISGLSPSDLAKSSMARQNDDISKYVVQVGVRGRWSLGSGFILRELDELWASFDGLSDDARMLGQGLYIVTASHLFSIPYTHEAFESSLKGGESLVGGIDFPVNIKVQGKVIKKAAKITGIDILSDMAILSIYPEKVGEVVQALGFTSLDQVKGLTVANSMEDEVDGCGLSKSCLYRVYGYPTSGHGILEARQGLLIQDGYATAETSNFGVLKKFRIKPIAGHELAEKGLSGGPILNAANQVVGIAIEKPTDGLDLIGVDITGINKNQQLLTMSDQCYYHFNPFDGVFRLVNSPSAVECNYGSFGAFADFVPFPLPREWMISEVLAIREDPVLFRAADPDPITQINEAAFISSFSLINEAAFINGQNVVASEILETEMEDINNLLKGDFKFNPDSFKAKEIVGVRMLKMPAEFVPYPGFVGKLITQKKERPSDLSYSYISTMREFVIWLHQHFSDEEFGELLK
jgi:hypothetical protein